MRYRSFGRSEVAVSTVTLTLQDTPGKARAADWRGIAFAGLESGINAFELAPNAGAAIMAGLAEALQSIESGLCFVTLRCNVGAEDLAGRNVLRRAAEVAELVGVELLDCVMLEGPGLESIGELEVQAIQELRAIARHIGVAHCSRVERLAYRGAIDAVALEYNLTSPVTHRNLIRQLSGAGLAIVVDGAFPAVALEPPPPPKKTGFFGKPVYAPTGSYDFMHETPGWTAEQICMGYILTEPGVSTIRFGSIKPDRIAAAAAAADRDVPGGLSAQVEMARFGASGPGGTRRQA